MANYLTPKGHLIHGGRPAARATDGPSDGPLVTATAGDVVLERRGSAAHGPIGDIAVGGARIVTANPGDDSLSVLDSTTLKPVHTVALDGEPVAVVACDDRAYVSVAAAGHDAVYAIDLDTGAILADYPVAFVVTALAVSPNGKRVYAARSAQNRVDISVIDVTAERVGTIDVGHGPAANIDALRVDPNGKRLYLAVTDAGGSRLIVLDTETARIDGVVPVGSPIRDIAYAGGEVYVLTSDRTDGGAVHVVDLSTKKVSRRAAVGGAPTQLVVSADQTRAYVVDYDRVAVVCTLRLEVVDALKVDARPSCVAQGDDGTALYVADYSGAVNLFAVESSIETLYSQFLATDPIALSVPRALQHA